MNKSRLLWILVAANVLFAFGSVGAEAFFGWTLPRARRVRACPVLEFSRLHTRPTYSSSS